LKKQILKRMSVSTENFLKNIYLYSCEKATSVTSGQLAEKLHISSAAVTDMARKLGEKGLLEYKPYRSLVLSDKGRFLALKVVRKHRLWELFLHKVLEMDLLSVHEEAEKLEHNTSDFLMDEISRHLGEPDFDPHGEPIPDAKGSLPAESGIISLGAAEVGKTYTIKKFLYYDSDTSEMYEHYGLHQNMTVLVLKVFDFDGSIEIETGEKSHIVISRQLAEYIYCSDQTTFKK